MKNKDKQSAIDLAKAYSGFLSENEGRRSLYTINGYRDAMHLYIEYCEAEHKASMDNFDISFLSSDKIIGFMNWMRYKREVKPQTCNLRLSQMRAFLKHAAKDPQYREYYIKAVEIKRFATTDTSKVVEPLSKAAIKAIINAPGTDTRTGLKYTALISMLYTMSTRLDEVLSIKVGELIFDSSKPHVTIIGKGRKARTVYIMSSVVPIIRKYIRSEHGSRPDPDAYLFFSQSKGLFAKQSERGVNKQLEKYSLMAREICPEVPKHIHSHQFRHSMATHCLEDGMNVFQISKMLGHKSVGTTMTYLGMTVAMTEDAVKKVESTTARSVKPKWSSTMKLKDLF